MSDANGRALALAGLVVTAGAKRILDGVDLDIASGTIVAVIGPNGAGKTTLLDAISGTIPGIAGSVGIDGSARAAHGGRPRAGVGRVFQGSPMPETLTVSEVAVLATEDRARAAALLQQFGLTRYATRFVAELSTGMRRILDLAVAASGAPSILLLDEPASGLAQAEIEHLADIVKKWRDTSGGVVIMVEHDAWLVRAVADRVVMLEGGKVESDGTPDEVLDHVRARTKPRLRNPTDPRFKEALSRVSSEAVAPVEIVKQTVSAWTIMRLGLREFAAGMASILLFGVLNRVMKIELGISLGVTAALLASYNLAAPIALGVGHRSDERPIFGRRRTPYILGGTLIASAAVATTPHIARRLAEGIDPLIVMVMLGVFVVMGIGLYSSGTVFLALLADIVPERERARAISIVYIELTLGILAGVALVEGVLKDDASNIGTLFAIAAALMVVLTTIAVWGKEPATPATTQPEAPERVPFRRALRSIVSMSQARAFFLFAVMTQIFLFLQQAVLEPYGGDVLGLPATTTSAFNAVTTIGLLAGMYTAGRPFTARYGHKKIARVGMYVSSGAFGLLTLAALLADQPFSWFALFWMGIGAGIFTVAGLALMMDLVDRRRTAMFIGAWTIARALADASAVAGGGAVFEAFKAWIGSQRLAYAFVFGVEAVGIVACLPLLKRFSPERFAAEAAESEGVLDRTAA